MSGEETSDEASEVVPLPVGELIPEGRDPFGRA
jgi:hypothetical protein